MAEMKDLAASSPFAAASLANLGRVSAAAGTPGTLPGGADSAAGFAALPFLSHMAATGTAPPGASAAFLHHFVDPRHPFSAAAAAAAAGAFKPFLTSAAAAASSSSSPSSTTTSSTMPSSTSPPGIGVKSSFPSAFQPPGSTKVDRKGSPPALFSPGQNLYPRSNSVGKFFPTVLKIQS